MAIERDFVERGMRRSRIDEFLSDELARAGYGGMEMARTPMGTEITLKAEKPGMVIGKGGQNIRELTTDLEDEFEFEDLQIDVQEVDEPDLNARIVADKLANALERGWYFRDAGRTTLSRIMESGALGAEIVFSGKVTGARSRVVKYKQGYIKHCGDPAETIVQKGYGTAVMKLGTIGVQVRIIPPDAELPDKFEVAVDADTEGMVPDAAQTDVQVEAAGSGGIEEMVEEPEAVEGAPTETPEGSPLDELPGEGEEEEGAEAVEEEPEESDADEDEPEAGEEAEPEPVEDEAAADEADEEAAAEAEEAEAADEDQEDAADSGGVDAPDSIEELEELSYRELQSLAKEAGVKANLKTEEMVDRIAEELDIGGGS